MATRILEDENVGKDDDIREIYLRGRIFDLEAELHGVRSELESIAQSKYPKKSSFPIIRADEKYARIQNYDSSATVAARIFGLKFSRRFWRICANSLSGFCIILVYCVGMASSAVLAFWGKPRAVVSLLIMGIFPTVVIIVLFSNWFVLKKLFRSFEPWFLVAQLASASYCLMQALPGIFGVLFSLSLFYIILYKLRYE